MRGLVVFVYFRAQPSDDERVAAAIRSVQDTLRTRIPDGLVASFGRRREEPPGQRTWLEGYELAAGGDADALLALRRDLAMASGLAALHEGEARVEVFEMRGDAPCA